MRRRRPFTFAAPLLLLGAACAAGDDAPPAVAVRDSAGIRIVESTRPALPPDECFRVSERPPLVIGSVDSGFVGVVGAVRLTDGRIVVADFMTFELRIFAPDGRLLRVVGRLGGGPGEFSALSGIEKLSGDSVIALDPLAGRETVFSPDGDVLQLRRSPPPAARFADGTVVRLQGAWTVAGDATGYIRDPLDATWYAPDGSARQTVRFPGHENYRIAEGGRIYNIEVPLARALRLAVHENRLFAGTGDEYAVDVYGADGKLQQRIRWHGPDRRLTADEFDAYAAAFLNAVPDENSRRRRARVLAEAPFRDELPAYAELRTDAAGNLWARSHARPGSRMASWSVFDPQGRWLCDAALPADLTVTEIGTDYVLGIWKDELDIPFVHLHRMDAAARPESAL